MEKRSNFRKPRKDYIEAWNALGEQYAYKRREREREEFRKAIEQENRLLSIEKKMIELGYCK